jgi:hypothetical protein
VQLGHWEAASRQRFLSAFAVLLALLLGVAAVTVFTGTWWTTVIAVLYSLALPIQYYMDARAKHRFLARLAVLAPFLSATLIAMNYFRSATPDPLFSLALLEFTLSVAFAIGITALLCERFLTPRLRPRSTLSSCR